MKRNKQPCPNCNKEISFSNFKKHIEYCGKKTNNISQYEKVGNLYKCPHCEKLYSKYGISAHVWRNHTEEGLKFDPTIGYKQGTRKGIGWMKGLTKETDERVLKLSQSNSKKMKGRIGTKHSEETKLKLRNKRLEFIKENPEKTAWRMRHKSSYAESFFEKIISNEFNDKNYVREYQFGLYAIDFAWVDKKLAIEIDGSQHELSERKKSDEKKDKLLVQNGWKVLRIKWKDMFNETQKFIKIAKDFIDN